MAQTTAGSPVRGPLHPRRFPHGRRASTLSQGHLKKVHEVEATLSRISPVTDAVLHGVKAWQGRPLDTVPPIICLDAIHVKIWTGGTFRRRPSAWSWPSP